MDKTQYFFLSTGYSGGATRFIYDHLSYLTKKKKKTILIDDQPYKTYSRVPSKTIVKKIRLNKFDISSIYKLKKILFDNKFNKIVFLTNFAFLLRYYFLVTRFNPNKIRIILTIHSGLLNLNFRNYFAGLIFSLIYKKIDYLYFGSNSAKNWWLKFYPWMKIKKNLVYYNGVELQKKINLKKKKKLSISFVGRLEEENDPEFFLRIAKDYLKIKKNAIFNVFGKGTMYNHLRNISKEKEIKFCGWQEKNRIYKNTDILIITSKVNNFPYVALEAKSFGIPIISCSKGDIKKIIRNNFDGYIRYTNSTNVIIKLINRISKNYSKFSRNSIQRSKLFEINSACKSFWKNIL